jgi:hypothetical protein
MSLTGGEMQICPHFGFLIGYLGVLREAKCANNRAFRYLQPRLYQRRALPLSYRRMVSKLQERAPIGYRLAIR